MKPETTSKRKVLVAIATAQAAYFRGIGRYARERDWHLVMDMVYTGAVPTNWAGDGILAVPGHNRQLHALIRSSTLPCVALSIAGAPMRVPRVTGANSLIGRTAADHFIERGYRNFAWAPFTDETVDQERLAGFKARLGEYGFDCWTLPPAHLRVGSRWSQNWRERRDQLIADVQKLPRPAAIFAFNDCVASEVIDACRDAGFTIPDQIAVLGVDNEPAVCDGSPVPLSSIQHDLETIGYRGAELLDRLMAGEDFPSREIRVAPKGVAVRVSTDMLAVGNDRVAHALRYIAQNFDSPMLSVSSIADGIGVSRRHLERMFRTELNCTINERIVHTRMQAAARLLKTHPRARMPDVAQSVGLTQPKNFFKAFRRFFQMSPAAYRQDHGQTRWIDRPTELNTEATPQPLALASGEF